MLLNEINKMQFLETDTCLGSVYLFHFYGTSMISNYKCVQIWKSLTYVRIKSEVED